LSLFERYVAKTRLQSTDYKLLTADHGLRTSHIRFTPKGVKVTKGSPTRNFVSALIDLQQEFNLSKGKIIATAEGKRIRVEASKSLPPEIRQRVRNLWAVFG